MTNVSTQAELAAAIAAQETDIVVTASFLMTQRQTISYTVTISSDDNGPYTLTKADNFSDSIFYIYINANLTLRNIILDGAKQTHSPEAENQPLIFFSYGSLILDSGSVLQNNMGRNGGAIYVGNGGAVPISLTLRGNATIRNNYANNGGGIYYYAHYGPFDIGDQVVIENNEAGLGGGIYFISRITPSEYALNIGGDAKITGNKASTIGGGIYVLQGSVLRISDRALISGNTAGVGGGVAFYGTDAYVDDGVKFLNNTATQNGGAFFFSSDSNAGISLHGLFQANTAVTTGGVYIHDMVQGNLDLSRARFIENVSTSSSNGAGGVMIDRTNGANTVLPITMDGTVFERNQSNRSGGGLLIQYNITASFELSANGCRFDNNTAESSGGGLSLFATEESSAMIQNCSFSNNHAFYGGGLNVEMENGSVTIANNTQIIDNHGETGGGIYHASSSILNLDDVNVSQNTATEGSGIYSTVNLRLGPRVTVLDGVFIGSPPAIPTIKQNLSNGSVIQLLPSVYITPDPQGFPIIVADSTLPLLPQDAAAFRVPPQTFAGWGARLSDDRTKVVLAPIVYEIFYQNTLGAQNPNPTSYTVLTPTTDLIDLENVPDQRFMGWFDAPDGGTRITQIPLGSTGNKTLYAHWQSLILSVTYHGNDEGGPPAQNVPLPQSVQEGSSVTLSDESPTREGYLFLSWNTAPDGSGITYHPQDTVENVTENIDLYALWQLLPPTEHVLAYHPNDVGGPPAQNIPENVSVPDGDPAHISTLTPTRDGFAFTGWNTDPLGAGTFYSAGDTISNVRANIDLFAQWTPLPPLIHTLTYRGNDIGGPPAQNIPLPQSVEDGQSILLSSAIPTRAGYRFIGWNTDPLGTGTFYSAGDTISNVRANIDLFAQWQALAQKDCMIYFMPNTCCPCQVSGMPSPMRTQEKQWVCLPCSTPHLPDCCFAGWNTRADGCGCRYVSGDQLYVNLPVIYLFAQWI